MRTALLLVAAAVVVFLAGWLIDDKVFGDDLPRNVNIAGVDVGGTSTEVATARLNEAGLDQQLIEMQWAGVSLQRSAAELGVSVDIDAAIVEGRDRGSAILRPFNWAKSLFVSRPVELSFSIEADQLSTFFGVGPDATFPLDFGNPQIELVRGQFVEASQANVPSVDSEELQVRVLEAAQTHQDGPVSLPVPVAGSQAVSTGAESLIQEASELTAGGIRVHVLGTKATYLVPEAAVRSWVRFGGSTDEPSITIDSDAAQSTIESLFWGLGEAGDEAEFSIDNDGGVHIVGGAPGSVCCTADSADRIRAALEAGDQMVDLLPIEDPDARGVAWAQSLGIVELVGEFTTNFKPGQTRVHNIARISDITRGAIIEPGEEFSINDYVGVRTRDKGFVSAGVIVNGVFNSSVGGGISQYATTLFNAAFFAGLDFGEYQSHSIYISRYPYGREATVSHPHPDLEIINNTPYAILLWPTTTDDSITVRLFSTKWVQGEQTGQSERAEGVSCTRVSTQRTRTWVEDGHTEIDYVTARYRPEGRACDGSSTRTTTTTTPVTTPPSTTVP